MEQKYYLSVGAIFKNESNSIKEWIKHYLIISILHRSIFPKRLLHKGVLLRWNSFQFCAGLFRSQCENWLN